MARWVPKFSQKHPKVILGAKKEKKKRERKREGGGRDISVINN